MTPMTLSRAYALLRSRWPRQSFSIDLTIWHHDRSDTGLPDEGPTVEWSIWENDAKVHHRGPSLETAMELALGCDADLAALERTIEWAADRSGYTIHGTLTQEKPA